MGRGGETQRRGGWGMDGSLGLQARRPGRPQFGGARLARMSARAKSCAVNQRPLLRRSRSFFRLLTQAPEDGAMKVASF